MNPKGRMRQMLFLCLGFLMTVYTGTCSVFADGEVISSDSDNPWKARISVSYSVTGSSNGSQCTFLLRGVTEDTPMPEMKADSAETVKLTLEPNSSGDFGEITYTDPGIYQYEVRRQDGKDTTNSNIARDDSVYRVTMVVRTDGEIQQVRETDGDKVTEIHYEDNVAEPISPLDIVKTGDMSALRLPILGLAICSLGLAIILRCREKKTDAVGLTLDSVSAMDGSRCGEMQLPDAPRKEKKLSEITPAKEAGPSGRKHRRRKREQPTEEMTILEEERPPLSEFWKMMSLALLFSLCLIGGSTVPTSAATKDLTVTYDKFEELPENYVRIIGLPLKSAMFTTTNSNIKKFNGYVGNNQTTKRDFIAYYGTVKYGSKNRTETADASTAANSVSGTITLRWNNQALLSDNTKADVKVVISNWKFNLGKCTNSKISGSTKVYVPILQESSAGSINTELCSSAPRTSYSTNSGTKDTTLSGAAIQAECQVQIQILKSGTDEAVDSAAYPRMLFGFRDLDVADSSLASNKSAVVRYNGAHAEGIERISGFESPVCLAKKSNTNPSMQTLVKPSTVGSNLRISGDGAKYESYNNATGTTGDDGSYYSGFISPVTPQGFIFKWTGSVTTTGKMLGTALWGQPEVAVKATAGEGGTIEKEGVTTYIINASTTYDYTPSPGYKVQSLTVEGKTVEFNENGGTYKFDKLYTSPAVERSSSTGMVTSTKVYTIDVQFRRIEHKITTKVTNGTIDESCVVGDGEDKIIHYQPDEGYELEMITVDGEIVDPDDNAEQYGFYSVKEDRHIEVVYTKIPAAKLTLRKQVTGALGDRSKAFEFEVRLRGLPPLRAFRADGLESATKGILNETGFVSDENGEAVLELVLKDDESAVLEEIPRDTVYQVIETASNHTASYQQKGTGDSPHFEQEACSNTDSDVDLAMQEETIEVCDGDIEIVYTNDRPIATVTGVGDSDTPYFVMGAILMTLSGGRLVYVLKYRRKNRYQ